MWTFYRAHGTRRSRRRAVLAGCSGARWLREIQRMIGLRPNTCGRALKRANNDECTTDASPTVVCIAHREAVSGTPPYSRSSFRRTPKPGSSPGSIEPSTTSGSPSHRSSRGSCQRCGMVSARSRQSVGDDHVQPHGSPPRCGTTGRRAGAPTPDAQRAGDAPPGR